MQKKIFELICCLLLVFSVHSLFADEDMNQDDDSQKLSRPITIVMQRQNFDLNPRTATYSSEAQLLDGLYEGLFSYDPRTLDPLPAIAESFKISRDKKRWTFTIREGAKLSDGTKITAQLVRTCWLELLKTRGAPYASLLDCIRGANDFRNGKAKESDVGLLARDEKTLVVNLVVPTAHFSRILCHHAFSVYTGKKNVFSGAFALKSMTEDKLVLEKNKNYWDAKHVYAPSITIVCSNDLNENSWLYNSGEADWVSGLVDIASVFNKSSLHISAVFGTEYIFFNCKNKPWNNADFRNALITAVPWEELRASSRIPATTLVYPLSGYPTVDGFTDYSKEDALEMIQEAKKKAGLKSDEKLSLVFGVSADNPRQKAQFETLKAAWEPLGVVLDMQATSADRYIDSIAGWNADLFSYSWIGDFADPLAFLELFREGSSLNQTQWKCPAFTELLNNAALTNDTTEHYKLLAKAENLLLDEGVILPISHSLSLHAIDQNAVGGWFVNALDIHPYKYLYVKQSAAMLLPNVVLSETQERNTL